MSVISGIRVSFAVLTAVLAWLFFDLAKHDPALAAGAGFLDDPYDAVGSFAIQCGAVGAAVTIAWFLLEAATHESGYISRGALTTAVSSAVMGVSDLVGQVLNPPATAPSPWLSFAIAALIAAGLVGVALNVRRETVSLPSLLAAVARVFPRARVPLLWADSHPIWTALVLGLGFGAALAVSHQLLEGGPAGTSDLVLLSLILILGEGLFVAVAWLTLGAWLHIHRGLRFRTAR